MNKVEIIARHEIELDEYTLKIQIESRVIGDLARNHIIPTAISYQNTLIKNVKGLKKIFGKDFESIAKEQLMLIKDISHHISQINSKITAMTEARKLANIIEKSEDKAHAYCDLVKPYFEEIRYHCDKLEVLIDDKLWPMAKYRELLFIR